MASSSLPPVTPIGIQDAERFATVVSAAFAGDALNRSSILDAQSLSIDTHISIERRAKYFLPSITSKAEIGAILVEAAGWAAVALWVPPEVKLPSVNLATLSAPLAEYREKFSAVKERHLRGRQYWYLNLLGRDPNRNDPGAIRALFEPYLLKAQSADLPVWLEATNVHARDVYIHFGFKVAEEVTIGAGNISQSGDIVEGGIGVTCYGMIKEAH